MRTRQDLRRRGTPAQPMPRPPERPAIEAELAKHDTTGLSLSIVHATEVIGMDEHPSQAARSKKDSSMVVGMGLQSASRGPAAPQSE